jgi:hypothetical protein
MQAVTKRADAINPSKRLAAHRRWWHDFWSRSYIFVSGDAEAERVTADSVLAGWLTAFKSTAPPARTTDGTAERSGPNNSGFVSNATPPAAPRSMDRVER